MGWNTRGWGWSVESIVGIDVITADGKRTHCSETVNPDLFWSARGSGPGFFAIVTRFHLLTREIPVGMLANTYVWDMDEYDAVMPWLLETSRIADPKAEIVALGIYEDNTETAPADQRPNLIVRVLTFNEDNATAQKSLELFASTVPRRETALVINEYERTSIANEVIEQCKQNPVGHRYCADNAYINHLPAQEVADIMKESFTTLPTVQTFTLHYSMAPVRVLPDMAFSMQTDHYLAVYCIWKDVKDDEKCQSWMRKGFEKVGKFSPGVYLGDSDFQVRKAPFLAPGRREKLEMQRKTWDPEGRMCGYLGLENE
jgi:FAD/FMN-containing dehydrogenase